MPSIRPENIRLKRAYEPPGEDDGTRVLVDRLWPRGVKKSGAAIDLWIKDIAPSAELRRWFAHDPERWPEFRRRYEDELRQKPEPVEELRALAGKGPLTLVFAARDAARNDAVVLRDLLLRAVVPR
jgi:uncharacterized protein YeaO (DUF488 family)